MPTFKTDKSGCWVWMIITALAVASMLLAELGMI
jgi:hypothetical protein